MEGNTSKQGPNSRDFSPTKKENDARAKKEGKKQTDYTAWDKAIQEVQAKYTGYTSLRIEEKKIQVIQGQQLRRTDTLKFNPKNGEITETTTYAEVPRAQKLKGWFYAFHTGSWGGIYTKVLYFLAAFIGGVLPLSGYYLWLKKKQRATR